ncbi:Bromodomain-containing protein [Stachybotrys elegans]|uniref:Bromodomain-containing protein n=1 Tax=Stachybotrys elegans TaxID=80388 RepID=A0A8K0WX21_9HYPO|nr:Bromodomain-containing protein [Stachybotrys elegans]
MDSKRKANGAAAVESDDRSSKRRKLAEFDLSKGETAESTTAYGLSFLEQIRRTQDKSGRLVAKYFEKLLPREGNADYYKQTRMPISLETIEEKLNNGEFKTLAELESYFKRMIANAKEFYPRSSPVFEDAERIRKALSNYMTKTNPAYSNRGYQALPTPLPPDDDEEEGDEDGEGEDAEGEDEVEEPEEDGQQDDEEDDVKEDAPAEEEEEEEEEDDAPSSRSRSIVLKRRGPRRASRNSSSQVQESPRTSIPPSKPDHQYEDVPFKGLSFQQAQEKIVEEMIRHQEPDYEDSYFEPFINLPPRALKDYYRIVSDPISLKKLQKIVCGVQGRNNVTGMSEFKTWAAFEEKAKLLWTNAYFYNEEDSEIYALARELEAFFYKQFKEAQAAVPEPSQPKIKLKVGGAETPVTGKKITIHVGGRGGTAESPAQQATPSASSATNGHETNGTARPSTAGALQPNQVDKARSVSLSAPSPSPSAAGALKLEDAAKASPSDAARPPSAASGQAMTGVVQTSATPATPQPQAVTPQVNGAVEPKRLRRPGKGFDDALISRLRIELHPTVLGEPKPLVSVLPHPKEMQNSATVTIPVHFTRVHIIARLPHFLQDRQYNLWALIDNQTLKASPHPIPNQMPNEHVFDVMLHPGINTVEAHLIAAIPASERVPGGPEVELEVFTVFVNVMRM